MTQPDQDLEQQLAYLASNLLNWRPSQDTTGWYYDPKRQDFSPTGLDYLLTGDGMLEIIEAMFKRGQHCMLESWPSRNFRVNYTCCFTDGIEDADSEGADSLPEAVARAAYEALNQ